MTRGLAYWALLPFTLLVLGCETKAYCFSECDGTAFEDKDASSGGTGGGATFTGGSNGDGTGGVIVFPDGGDDDAGCTPGAEELCNGRDDNCNGEIDEDIDFTRPEQCGSCANNCLQILSAVVPESITCELPTGWTQGVPGRCVFSLCYADYYDVDKDQGPNSVPGCEYYCPWNTDGKNTSDPGGATGCGRDDDCDGVVDEDVDLCSVTDCGRCGNNCSLPNATPKCVSTRKAGEACTQDNTSCGVEKCADGWYDIDKDPRNGCEYRCDKTGNEICDGIDNDCDGLVDNADPDLTTQDPSVGKTCYGGTEGQCAALEHQGVRKCINAALNCCDTSSNDVVGTTPGLPTTGLRNNVCKGTKAPFVLRPGDQAEICDGLDNDCDGYTDAADPGLTGTGASCGPSKGTCQQGQEVCEGGKLVCQGGVTPQAFDYCNGADENCDGIVDGTLPNPSAPVTCTLDSGCPSGQLCLAVTGSTTKACAYPAADVGQPCQVPPQAPCVDSTGAPATCGTAGAVPAPQPCKAGIEACSNGVRTCSGAVAATATVDVCGEDSNCNGILDNQPSLGLSTQHCGSCNNRCGTDGDNVTWVCQLGACKKSKCNLGYIDCDSDPNTCEKACLYSGQEQCNNNDDDCDCQVDELSDLTAPTPQEICGVATNATEPGCQAVTVTCTNGGWKCNFPAGICTSGDCRTSPDACDGKDNNCNGAVDEGFKPPFRVNRYLGQACASDDGMLFPGHGDCRGTGTYLCKADGTDTECTAVQDLSKAGPELCDGKDNDCDGFVDETYEDPGPNPEFVKPAVVQVGSTWMFQYEASRPNATAASPGSGNGYHQTAPAGTTLDETLACSVQGRIPWFNVTPEEAEQTCAAIGGEVCTLTDWQMACGVNQTCTWGYGSDCNAGANYTSGPYCNLQRFDADPGKVGVQDGVIVTSSTALNQCYADLDGAATLAHVYDVTGNLREITATSGDFYTVMGGSFMTEVESGAACSFAFLSVDSAFQLYDTGFRCCFTNDPRVAP